MSDKNDATTVHIIQWLLYWRIPYQRMDLESNYTVSEFSIENGQVNIILTNNHQIINFNDIKAFWYRRGKLNIKFSPVVIGYKKLQDLINVHLREEIENIEFFLNSILEKLPRIGTYKTSDVNKLEVLSEAQKLGLKIPRTIITSNRLKLSKYFKDNFITKSIFTVFHPLIDNEGFINYTEKIDINTLPDNFALSLFQENIIKEADIRIFYLYGKFYSMAIRSQENLQTSIDFRKYDYKRPNRNVPFKLPEEIENKLEMLMKKMDLDTGSIDIILDINKEFYFLEINPVGQFNMTSVPCNYHLEFETASLLNKISYNSIINNE